MRCFLLIVLLGLFSTIVFAQNVTVTGTVKDSLQTPLEYANILAIPEAENAALSFAITNKKGLYELKLESNQSYEVTVSYLGYLSQTINLVTKQSDLTQNFILKEDPNQLDEVNLNYTPPVTVKQDTIIYLTDKFVTGEERKLRDVLKKLPGIEVDRDGNVTVNGKKVTKVLVEDKTFFTGNSKLAVNNIPADAVDKIEMLDNYSEVAMLKGLEDSDDLAMNIKLKEDKKKFVFGDVEAGAGVKERYVVHPNVFYYSPETTVNFIGDLNNTGVKSFTFRDYLEFEGGYGKLLENAGSYFSLYNSDFSKYLINQDFKANTNQFGAANIRQSLSNVTDVSGYVITNSAKTETLNETNNAYLNNDMPFVEDRTSTNNINSFFTIGKITLDYEPSFEEDLAYNTFIKVSNNDSHGLINTINPNQDNSIETKTDIKNIDFKQHINYSKKLSKSHTATLEATYNFQNDKPITNWLTNQQILQGLIPLEDDTFYNILQTKKVNSHTANAIVKDYWVLNNFNHLYSNVGVNTLFNNFFTNDEQLLSNGSINNFSSAGFGNDFKYQFVNTFVGLEYKFQIGIATFKPAVFYQFYLWNTYQEDFEGAKNKGLLLPQFTTKIEFNNSEKINFKYQLNLRFPSVDYLASNFILSSFNSVFKGNPNLEDQRYHSLALSYYKFSLFKGLNLNAGVNFTKKVKQFKTITQLQGIDQYNTPILFEQPEQTWTINGGISKKINKIRYKFKSRFAYNDFYQILNNETNLNVSKNLSSTVSLETFFKNFPNVEIGYTKAFNNYKALGNDTKFTNDTFFVYMEYDFLEDFIFKADYNLDVYKNNDAQINNHFDNANTSLFYQTEDSPWGFEISVSNLFDTKFKQSNSFSNFLISDSKTFIMPRIMMFKVSYKL
ncbi:carboxypeptidase-like regulatory domain-containing protein [Mangrovimonas futianensis]|uniref:carboxypeptidase-like regulatory domain-containing protein n=1 Tax=Mangrovimonas futianensis TaxID=2895523 RepID=UPI001E378B69|nr:carboxypeptidase-like regulatory domain-containing protein [Mangrovimonas futianensis]MCF1420774.1 carboxypeptidase-like regulatory domain-containing protein [Mangrovimonas futianensis]